MQKDLHRLEQEASQDNSRSEDQSGSTLAREPSLSTWQQHRHPQQQPQPQQSDNQPQDDIRAYQSAAYSRERPDAMASTLPSFSPFPKVKGDNIPPSDDEKEEILWTARKHVLGSQNVSMQITWARDVLNWVEITSEAAARDHPDKPRSSTPRMEHELRVDALNIITYLSGQEHPQALYIKAKWLEFGKFGNRIDKREAYAGYKRAADLGNPRSEYRIGMLYEQSNDIAKAKEHYHKGLVQSDSASLYRLGMMSLLGQLGEVKDYKVGLERIKAAADAADEDSPQGAFVYGMLCGRELPDIYIPDSMLPNSPETAMVYIEKSAYLGFAKAQHKMGQIFELCQFGCDFNPAYSLHYYGLAANQGNAEAALGVSRWFLFGYDGVFKKNEALAFQYALQASKAKLATGEFAMGYYHEIGVHVESNLQEARRWYQIAADNGNNDAKSRLESLNQDQTLSKADHETTTLTRIKSQHGSQRGKRPERLKNAGQQMPTLNEGSAPSTPIHDVHGAPKPGGPSPRPSPQPSPGLRPTVIEHASFPDPARASIIGSDRPSAFGVRLDGNQSVRPHSAAPYPDDDRKQLPMHGGPPKAAVPYPEDDVRGPSHGGRPPHGGPQADRPSSAFGVNTQGPPGRLPASQSAGNLHPAHGGRPDPRGRIASAGAPGPGGYNRQPSPGPPSPVAPQYGRDPRGRPPSSNQQYPNQNPGMNRMPNQPPPGAMPPAGSNPYGAPMSGRPVSAAPPHGDPRYSPNPGAVGRPPHMGQNPMSQQQQQRISRVPVGQPVMGQPPMGPGPGPGQGPGPGPGYGPGRVGSAPPSQMQRPPPENKPSPVPSAASTPAPSKPSKGPVKPGPATFEDMGIPQGKQDGDCVSYQVLSVDEIIC